MQDENLKIFQKENKNIQKTKNIVETISANKTKRNLIFPKEKENNFVNFNEHIKEEDFKIKMDHLNNQQKNEINKLIDEYRSVFARDKYDRHSKKIRSTYRLTRRQVNCSKRPYKCIIKDKKEIEKQVSKLLKKNLIEESYNPFAAPVTLAFKKENNKRSRLCVDFRDLNKIVVPQAQPFPLIEDLITKTRNCKFFSTLDINSAFWSIPLRIENRKITAFVMQKGHYQWTCLPFGLKTAPAIFQRILGNILRKYKLVHFTVNFIDDILIFSKSFAEHIQYLKLLLEAIKQEGLKFTKCMFASNSVKYLGHVIENNLVMPVKDNLISIKNFPIPKTQKNIRQFLGKINFYHEYIPKSAIILDPLHKLLKKISHLVRRNSESI